MSVVVLRVEGDDHATIAARMAKLAEDRPAVWRYRLLDIRKAFEMRGKQWHVIEGVSELHIIDLPETFQFQTPQPPSVTVLLAADVARIIRDGQFLWWA